MRGVSLLGNHHKRAPSVARQLSGDARGLSRLRIAVSMVQTRLQRTALK